MGDLKGEISKSVAEKYRIFGQPHRQTTLRLKQTIAGRGPGEPSRATSAEWTLDPPPIVTTMPAFRIFTSNGRYRLGDMVFLVHRSAIEKTGISEAELRTASLVYGSNEFRILDAKPALVIDGSVIEWEIVARGSE